MKITICGSSAFKEQMLEYCNKLKDIGHEPFMHPDYIAFINGEKQDLWNQIVNGEHSQAKKSQGYIKWYHDSICKSDAILVLNYDKKGIKNYIGGNTLMEIGFAYCNNKKIFLLNDIPEDVFYADEIKAMADCVINGDISRII